MDECAANIEHLSTPLRAYKARKAPQGMEIVARVDMRGVQIAEWCNVCGKVKVVDVQQLESILENT